MPIEVRDADLNEYPSVLPHAQNSENTHIAIGDLHGNALKLIYILIEEGVLELNEADYKKLRDIYQDPFCIDPKYQGRRLNAIDENIKEFKRIISNAQVNQACAITLIGDELADRGNNDYFTLLVLQRLKEADVDIDIMISNHSVEFIRNFQLGYVNTGLYSILPDQTPSLGNMSRLMNVAVPDGTRPDGTRPEGTIQTRPLIDSTEVRKIVDETYKPMVKAIGYTLDSNDQITIYSHAPIGLETIKALAQKFNIEYKDRTSKDLFSTIDKINEYIGERLNANQLAQLFDQELYQKSRERVKDNPTRFPLDRLTWNRALGNELEVETSGGLKVKFVHGHIGEGVIRKNNKQVLDSHENIDSFFGKGSSCNKTGSFSFGEVKHKIKKTDLRIKSDLKKEDCERLLAEFTENLEALHRKGEELSRRGYLAGGTAAHTLYNAFDEKKQEFIADIKNSTPIETAVEKLKNNCNHLIDREIQSGELKKFRGFFSTIRRLLNALSGNKGTDSIQKVVKIKEALREIRRDDEVGLVPNTEPPHTP